MAVPDELVPDDRDGRGQCQYEEAGRERSGRGSQHHRDGEARGRGADQPEVEGIDLPGEQAVEPVQREDVDGEGDRGRRDDRHQADVGLVLDREGRARVYEVTIVAAVTIRDLKEDKILFDNQNFIFRDSFEFSADPRSFFDEEDPAVERIARAFAESAVSAFINGIGVRQEKK